MWTQTQNTQYFSGVPGPKEIGSHFPSHRKKTGKWSEGRLLALNKIENVGRYLWPWNKMMKSRSLVCSHGLTQGQGDLDNKGTHPFKQDGNGAELGDDRSALVASDFRSGQNTKIRGY